MRCQLAAFPSPAVRFLTTDPPVGRVQNRGEFGERVPALVSPYDTFSGSSHNRTVATSKPIFRHPGGRQGLAGGHPRGAVLRRVLWQLSSR